MIATAMPMIAHKIVWRAVLSCDGSPREVIKRKPAYRPITTDASVMNHANQLTRRGNAPINVSAFTEPVPVLEGFAESTVPNGEMGAAASECDAPNIATAIMISNSAGNVFLWKNMVIDQKMF